MAAVMTCPLPCKLGKHPGALCTGLIDVQQSAGLCSGTGRQTFWDSALNLGRRVKVLDSDTSRDYVWGVVKVCI